MSVSIVPMDSILLLSMLENLEGLGRFFTRCCISFQAKIHRSAAIVLDVLRVYQVRVEDVSRHAEVSKC